MARRTKDAPDPTKSAGRPRAKATARAAGSGAKRGRVTPKGGPAARVAATPGRYTAPVPRQYRSSPWWVPALMVGLFTLGVLCILLNYINVLPGGASNFYLLGGLVLIVAGFIVATRWH